MIRPRQPLRRRRAPVKLRVVKRPLESSDVVGHASHALAGEIHGHGAPALVAGDAGFEGKLSLLHWEGVQHGLQCVDGIGDVAEGRLDFGAEEILDLGDGDADVAC